ncbi:MAG: lipoate--protein ligase family protein [Pirellulales bacterium]|nr:lipoate--protein ligase family protein [Pirellulales bacterium]
MRYLDLTLPTAAENLAFDETLLAEAEAAGEPREALRIWESPRPMVVVGRSSRVEDEVRLDVCRELGIPVLRRVSGGAAVLAGPGCLMYALVLDYRLRPRLRAIDRAHRWVLDAIVAALTPHVPGVSCRGTSDLAVGNMKFSGSSARCRRNHLLYHGTLLYDFPLSLIERCLKIPPRMPHYRAGRGHAEFLTNLPLAAETIRRLLIEAFDARENAASRE